MKSKENLLIIDDELDLLKGLKRLLFAGIGIEILLTQSPNEALEIIKSNPVSVVLSDIKMPEMDGLDLLSVIKHDFPAVEVIMMTAFGTIDIAVEALKRGAFDFVTKPIDIERLTHLLKKCLEHQRLLKKTILLEKKLQEKDNIIIGESMAIKSVLNTLKIVAKSDLTVLITGESGTGKELASRAIYEWSNRKDKEFIVVNCPAIPENLLESELFGYKKGSFTHASADKKGLFELANNGTIFLDEIGDISINLQTKLLRFLQEGEIRAVGSNITKKVDVRIIAATNQDMLGKIKSGLFREDLYFRLNVLNVRMPGLREIKEDVPLIAMHFLKEFCLKNNLTPKIFSPGAIDRLLNFSWTGNVRELKNIVERSSLFSQGEIIDYEDLRFDSQINSGDREANLSPGALLKVNDFSDMPYHDAKDLLIKDFAVDYLTNKLKETKGNVTLAAQKSGLERQYFQQLMRKYNILSEKFKVQ